MKKNKQLFNTCLRKEKFVQYSGEVNLNKIKHLKEDNYYVKDIPLDGDAPKQYIKAYFYYKDCPRKSDTRNWDGYFAKFGRKSYPHESVLEFVINKVGESLGLLMNETELVKVKEQVRFLSKDFLSKNEKLIHGIEVVGEYFEDFEFAKEIDQDRKERRKYLTFELVEKAIVHVYPNESVDILESLVKLIVFDAIVGNNDRHYYNWGLIGNIKKTNDKSPKFAPIYDSARALLWNLTDEAVDRKLRQHQNGSDELEHFVKKTKPRISFDGKPNANHFELVQFLYNYKLEYKTIILELVTLEKKLKVEDCLKHFCSKFFENNRKELILEVINKRFEHLQAILL